MDYDIGVFDALAVSLCLAVLLAYHCFLYLCAFFPALLPIARALPVAMNLRNSAAWVVKHKEKGDAPSVTLAIQTFRNTILVAVFVGGNAFTYGYSFADSYGSYEGQPLLQWRAIIIATFLFCSFLCWSCVIRFASHLGYLVGTIGYEPSDQQKEMLSTLESGKLPYVPEDGSSENETFVKAAVNHKLMMIFFSMGFRFMFISLPFAFLTMGSAGLIAATVALMLFLFIYDYKS